MNRQAAESGQSGRLSLFAIIGPGIVVAATGIGAGDLATATFSGSQLGTVILWAVVVGALFKFVVNEGLARWQLATGQTFIEGIVAKGGPVVAWLFLPYLLLWSFFVGSALMSACGVTLHAMIPLFEDAAQGKLVFGIISSVVGLALVLIGGYAFFEKTMSLCIGVMFVIVVVTALLLWPDTGGIISGLLVPHIPDAEGQGLPWTTALIGGVGGTLTILCYGYWIREKGRHGLEDLKTCRIDLSVGYTMTAFFGLAMVIIGSTVTIEGRGAGLIVVLADRLTEPLGTAGKWAFLIGALSAVFSSLLGVWQAIPYLFADIYSLALSRGQERSADLTKTGAYRGYMIAIALVPMVGLAFSFKEIQKIYAIIGALFLPLVTVGLLILNGRRVWVGAARNGPLAIAGLVATLGFFGYLAARRWLG